MFGKPLSGDILVNTITANNQTNPSVAMDSSGDFVVSFSSYEPSAPDVRGIWARRFDTNGNARDKTEFLVNSDASHPKDDSSVAMDAKGDFTVVWQDEGLNGSSYGVYGQRFNSAAVKQGGQFQVSTYASGAQIEPRIAMDANGDSVVAWSSFLEDGNGYGVYAKRYSSSGVAQGKEFLVNQTTLNNQWQPSVAMDSSGAFVISWTSLQVPDSDGQTAYDGVYARMYNANGTTAWTDPNTGMAEFRINATITPSSPKNLPNAEQSAVAMDGNGNFTTVWLGPYALVPLFGEVNDIYARVVLINPQSSGGSTASPMRSAFDGWGGGWTGAAADGLTPVTVTVPGGPGNDTFQVVPGSTPSAWSLKVNGTLTAISSGTGILVLDGGSGSNTLDITDASGNETIELWSNHIAFTYGGLTLETKNISNVNFQGYGNDSVTMNGAGGDTLTASATSATLTNGTYSLSASGFSTLDVVAGAKDTANLTGTPGSDTLTVRPAQSVLAIGGKTITVNNFYTVNATGGGSDTANFYDNGTAATFTGTPSSAALTDGKSYGVTATGFRYAYTTATGASTAILSGAGVSDFFTGKLGSGTTPSAAVMTDTASGKGNKYYLEADGFKSVQANAVKGTGAATLTDTTGSATFTVDAAAHYGQFVSGAYSIKANNFPAVTGSGQGSDQAAIYDSKSADVFTAHLDTDTAVLTSGSSTYTASVFDKVQAYSRGGKDTANFYGNAKADTFNFYASAPASTPSPGKVYGEMYDGTLFANATGFHYVNAHGAAQDTANLWANNTSDVYTGSPTQSVLKNKNFTGTVSGFGQVNAHGVKGNKNATVNDAALSVLLDSTANTNVRLTSESPSVKSQILVNGFAQVIANASKGNNSAKAKKKYTAKNLVFALKSTGHWKYES